MKIRTLRKPLIVTAINNKYIWFKYKQDVLAGMSFDMKVTLEEFYTLIK